MSETVENLSTLKINYLTQEQYDAAVSSGIIQENELYLTPTSGEQSALPSGGLMGQVLAKSSDDDYAVAWATIDTGHSIPSGGLNGQVLAKSSNADYAVAWTTATPGTLMIEVSVIGNELTSSKTYQEILNAYNNGWDLVVNYYGAARQIFQFWLYNNTTGVFKFRWSSNFSSGHNDIAEIDLSESDGNTVVQVNNMANQIYGLPAGGSIGQILAKSSNDDYALAWTTPSGGSDKVMVVTITYSSTFPYYSSNKTIDEIFTAIDNGYDVYLIYTGSYSDAAHEIYQLYSRSTTNVYFTRMAVSGGSIREDYFRIYKSNNDTLVTKSNYFASIPSVENQYYIVIKYDDSENKYFIDDYLSLSCLAYLDLTSGYRFGSIFAYYSEEGNHLPETGGYENYADYYYLQKYWNTEEHDEGEDSYNTISHVIFSKIDNTNGTVKFKSFLIEGGSWDNLTDATVTYSEVSLGQPSAAAGVSF